MVREFGPRSECLWKREWKRLYKCFSKTAGRRMPESEEQDDDRYRNRYCAPSPVLLEGVSSWRETSAPLCDKFQHILTFWTVSGLKGETKTSNHDQSTAGDPRQDGWDKLWINAKIANSPTRIKNNDEIHRKKAFRFTSTKHTLINSVLSVNFWSREQINYKSNDCVVIEG